MQVKVKVVPGASRDEVVGQLGDALKMALPGLCGDLLTDTRQPLIADCARVSRWCKCAVQEWV